MKTKNLINHDEPAYAIANHPHLPLYITGTNEGRLHLWQYNYQHNQVLDVFDTEQTMRGNGSTQNRNITRIKFNSYGDKFLASDLEGNLFMFRLNMMSTQNEPDFALKKGVGMETLDFHFINQGSVFYKTGINPQPHFSIYDSLLSPQKSCIMNEAIGGNIVLTLHDAQKFLIINSKTAGLKIFDIRMKKIIEDKVKKPLFNYIF